MKRLAVLAAAIVSMFATFTAQAKFNDYSRFYMNWQINKFDNAVDNLHSVGIGYVMANNITRDAAPLYLEYGFEADWERFTAKDDKTARPFGGIQYSNKVNMVSLNVPLVFTYHIAMFKRVVTFTPQAGGYLRFNALGQIEQTIVGRESTNRYDFFNLKDHDANPLPEDYPRRNSNYTMRQLFVVTSGPANRWQVGAVAGATFAIKRYFVGYRFNRFFTKYFGNGSLDTNHAFTVGYHIW